MTSEDGVFGNDKNIFAEMMLERGFYPENVPPVFQVENFHEAAIKYLTQVEFLSGHKPTEPGRYSASKRGGSRRIFHLPNPVFYVDCAIFFAKYKSEVFEHYQTTGDSLSVPAFSVDGRPVRIKSHADFHRARRKSLAASRYVVRTDISRFFYSVYTHSLPWALNGKPEAKKDRKHDSSVVFGNRLDYIVRQAQDGQTVGIPVGPDFSRYISEIIGKAIDRSFRAKCGDDVIYLRLVDDIYLGADDLDRANQILSSLGDSIREYQLDINESKTAIVESRYDLEPYWPVRVRREVETFMDKKPGQLEGRVARDFIHLLDEMIRTSNTEQDDGVVKFFLKKIDESSLWDDYWEILEPFLVRVVVSFPRSWDYVARVLSWRSRRKMPVSGHIWSSVLRKGVLRYAAEGADSEVCWILWLSKELGFGIAEEALKVIIARCGAMSVLISLDVYHSRPHEYNFPNSLLLDRLGPNPMLGEDWLLAYEADRQFNFKIKTKNLVGNPLFLGSGPIDLLEAVRPA
jgi:hypothetical protein